MMFEFFSIGLNQWEHLTKENREFKGSILDK